MRPLVFCLLLAAPLFADEFGRVLRAARHADRETRRAALAELADGKVAPSSRGQTERMIRSLSTYLSGKSLGPDRALAVRALGRLKGERAWQRLIDAVHDETDDRVLASMEEVFGQASPALLDPLLAEFRDAKDPVERAALLRMALAIPSQEARALARTRAAMIDHWAVQATAIEALRRDREPGIDALCIRLLDQEDPAVSASAIEVLTRRTHRRFGNDVIAWKTWWATREKVAALEKAMEEADRNAERKTVSREEKPEPVRSYFFGVPVRGRKVVYVFDMSGSMRSKLALATKQLLDSVKGLPPSSEFEVVFFNEFVYPWRRRLSHADPVTKAMLQKHVAELEIKSYTNLFDAIETGLELEPDEMFVISDGEPNRGRKQMPREFLAELKRLNPRGKVRIHTVSVVRTVDGGEHVKLLKAIAEEHGGQAVQRTLY
jgi:HEAT repeat protein